MDAPAASRSTQSAEAAPNSLGYVVLLATITAISGFLFGYNTAVINGVLLFLRRQFTASDLASEIAASAILVGALLGAAGASVIGISDLNGDGIPDLVVSEGGGGSTLGILLGKGNGTFGEPYYVGAGPFPGDILLENLHGQSACPDIAVPDVTGGVMVLIDVTSLACPGL